MHILGCHGSDLLVAGQGSSRACRACGFLVNDTLMVDGGTISAVLTMEQLRRIRHVLISHLHFDHIQGLPALAEALFDDPGRPVVLVSIPEVLKGLQTHIFNDDVYPDFTRIPDADRPALRFMPIEAGRALQIGDFRVTAIPVNHLVPTVGFIIDDGRSAVVYSGDTYETDEIWVAAAREAALKAAFIEVSFPNALAGVAQASRHLTPSLFSREFAKIGRPDLPLYAYHLKPRFRPALVEELGGLGIKNLRVLEEGQEIVL